MKTINSKICKFPSWLGITIVVCFAASFLYAEELSVNEVRAAVQTWVRDVTADSKPGATIREMEPYLVGFDTVAYIAHINGRGYCLCSVDDRQLPVYYYSPFNDYEPGNIHDRLILEEIGQHCEELDRIMTSVTPHDLNLVTWLGEIAAYREKLITRRISDLEGTKGFWDGPDSMSVTMPEWRNHQGWPFNDKCPMIINTAGSCTLRTATGCVAHTMAMIMKYWKWPSSGVGQDTVIYNHMNTDIPYNKYLEDYPFSGDYDEGDCRWNSRLTYSSTSNLLWFKGDWSARLLQQAKDIHSIWCDTLAYWAALDSFWGMMTPCSDTVIANFGATTYQWESMPDLIEDINTPAEINAVSTLLLHTGAAVNMDYGYGGSFTGLAQVPPALLDHFRYDPDVAVDVFAHCDEFPDTCPCWGDTIDTCWCDERPDTCEGAKKMVEEIQWLRPVQYGYGAPLNHSWAIFGYNRLSLPDQMQFREVNGWRIFDWIISNHPFTYYIAPEGKVRFIGNDIPGDGSPDNPFQNIEEAIATPGVEGSDPTLIFKAGSINTFSEPIEIDFATTLRGRDALITGE